MTMPPPVGLGVAGDSDESSSLTMRKDDGVAVYMGAEVATEPAIIGMALKLGRHATNATEDHLAIGHYGCRGQAFKTRNRIISTGWKVSLGRSGEVRNIGWRCIAVFGEPSLEEAEGILECSEHLGKEAVKMNAKGSEPEMWACQEPEGSSEQLVGEAAEKVRVSKPERLKAQNSESKTSRKQEALGFGSCNKAERKHTR